MKIKILYVELFQPFAQYRNPFTFYYAQTYPLPPKSTVIGMLQNATDMWYGWGKLDEIEITPKDWWSLKISIHGGFESTFWNYQQLIKGDISISSSGILLNRNKDLWMPLYGEGLKAQRTPVYQQELFNGHLFIFIKGKEEKGGKLLEEIKSSLENPKKVLSLGRSEDVIYIRKVEYISPFEEGHAKSNLWFKYPTYLNYNEMRDILKFQRYPVYSIPTQIRFENNKKLIKHKSEITKETNRWVEFTTVIHTRENHILRLRKNNEVKYERYRINNKEFVIPEQGWL